MLFPGTWPARLRNSQTPDLLAEEIHRANVVRTNLPSVGVHDHVINEHVARDPYVVKVAESHICWAGRRRDAGGHGER